MTTYLLHALAGGVFAISGAWATNFCQHALHRWTLGIGLVLAETLAVVTWIG